MEASWTNTLNMRFHPIPKGRYMMGEGAEERDEKPVHPVVISKDFFMQETPVTNSQYEAFDPQHHCMRGKNQTTCGDDDACTHVTWGQAQAFAEWLSQKEGRQYRLPTEAEWEYACRAGTHTAFAFGDSLPGELFVQEDFFSKEIIDMSVRRSQPNAWGIYDMHGLVEEWCMDWYAPYMPQEQQDPCGPRKGAYRVTRGGSVNTQPEFLRSANRMATLPEISNSITGFRLVCSETEPVHVEAKARIPRWGRMVSQKKAVWRFVDRPIFRMPKIYVRPPQDDSEGPFYPHNHVPTLAVLDNGDLFAAWFSAKKECGRELTVLASRLRYGADEWDAADEFYKIADRNMSSTAIVKHPNGKLYHFNGIAMSGTEFHLVSVFRSSDDNGATWSDERYMSRTYSTNKPICAPIVDREGRILVPADLYDMEHLVQGTVLFRSNEELDAFEEQTRYEPENKNFLTEHGKAGWIAGVHGAVVQLKDGRLLALGRSESRCGRQVIQDRMPMSISDDMGQTWSYKASPFPPIGFAQRCCLLRLEEGPIVLFSFTDPSYELRSGNCQGMDLRDAHGNILHGYGLYAAVSFDEGETWPVQRLITTALKPQEFDPGASVAPFVMDRTHAQPMGYMQAVQAPDHVIHLISSRLHYQMNLEWLTSPHDVGLME